MKLLLDKVLYRVALCVNANDKTLQHCKVLIYYSL